MSPADLRANASTASLQPSAAEPVVERAVEQAVGHGKVILLGEHSVVYGRPALAAAIPRGCRASAAPSEDDALFVEPWGVLVRTRESYATEDREMLRRAFSAVCERFVAPRAALRVHAVMQIPGGAGLGGSAALSVAVIRAFAQALNATLSEDEIIDASLAWERVFHGNPSGVDSAMATRGGLAVYRKGEPFAPVTLERTLCFVAAYSGAPGSTKQMVENVARTHARDPQKAEQIFDAIAAIVNNGKRALEDGDAQRLGQLFELNHQLLNTLMLSTTKLEEMCQVARAAGALGAKLTGGGGGGSMIALAHDAAHAAPIVSALRELGCDAFTVEVPA